MSIEYDFGGGLVADPLAALEEGQGADVRIRGYHQGVITWDTQATVASVIEDFARWCALDVVDLWSPPESILRWLHHGEDAVREEALRAMVALGPLREKPGGGRASASSLSAWSAARWTFYGPSKSPSAARLARGLKHFRSAAQGADQQAWETTWGAQRAELERRLAVAMRPQSVNERLSLHRQARYESWPQAWIDALSLDDD